MVTVFKKILNQNNDENRIIIIQRICDLYNSKIIKYTQSFKGRISKPKDVTEVPSKYISVNEYLKSNKQWIKILEFYKMTIKEKIDIAEYFDIMIKNWSTIAYVFKINSRTDKPIFSTIISNYGFNMYRKYKKMEEDNEFYNKHRVRNNTEEYTLVPTIQSDINNLLNIKKFQPDMSYKEIINLFAGDFSDKFKNIISELKEEDINESNINKLYNEQNVKNLSEKIINKQNEDTEYIQHNNLFSKMNKSKNKIKMI